MLECCSEIESVELLVCSSPSHVEAVPQSGLFFFFFFSVSSSRQVNKIRKVLLQSAVTGREVRHLIQGLLVAPERTMAEVRGRPRSSSEPFRRADDSAASASRCLVGS